MSEWHPNFHEINYDSKRSIKSLELETYKAFEAYYIKEGPIWDKSIELNNLLNPQLSWLVICKKIRYIHILADEIFNIYNTETSGIIQYPFKESMESIVFHMKSVIDMQVQLCDLIVEHDKIENEHRILIDSYGVVKKNPLVEGIIIGNEIYEADETNFLEIINNVFNSIKHCLLHPGVILNCCGRGR